MLDEAELHRDNQTSVRSGQVPSSRSPDAPSGTEIRSNPNNPHRSDPDHGGGGFNHPQQPAGILVGDYDHDDDGGSAGNLNAAPPVNTGPAAGVDGVVPSDNPSYHDAVFNGPGSIDNGTNNQNGYIPNNSGSAFMDPSVGGDGGGVRRGPPVLTIHQGRGAAHTQVRNATN